MRYLITDLEEPDHGCEGFMPGEELKVTLTLEDGRRIAVSDSLAYKMDWDIGKYITEEDIGKYGEVL